MRRILAVLALLAIPASAEDAAELCRRLGSEVATESASAVAPLRSAGPEADAALTELAESGRTGAALAGAVRAARKWDPEAAIDDIEIFALLDSPDPVQRAAGFARVVALGSSKCWRVARRIIESSDAGEQPQLISGLGNGPGLDRGWAKEALRWSQADSATARNSAASALAAHAGREQIGEINLWIQREADPGVRRRLWYVLLCTTVSPADFPPLPADPEEYAYVMEVLAGGNAPEVRQVAWDAAEKRLPSPISRAFWQDPARLQQLIGIEEYIELIEPGSRPSLMPLDVRLRMGSSTRPEARALAAGIEDTSPLEIARAGPFLADPEYAVRLSALHSLDRWDRTMPARPERARHEAFERLSLAVRTLMDAAAGASDPGEIRWAVRHLLVAGGPSSSIGATAYQSFWIAREHTAAPLAELESDKDVGPSAKRVNRLLGLGLPPQAVSMSRGLDSPGRVRQGWIEALDIARWRGLLASEDAEEKQLAVSLIGDAWDRLDLRNDLAADLLKLAADTDPAASQAAVGVLAAWSPGQIPERAEIDGREVWFRSRQYVLARLRSSLVPQSPLDRQKAALIQSHGDRALLLSAVRAGRYDQPATEFILIQRPGEAALLPSFLDRIETLNAPLTSAPWLSALASCSPAGSRIVAGLAKEGGPKVRPVALSTLLARPWSDSLAEPLVEAAAASADPAERSILLQALRLQPGRNRLPYSKRIAEAVATLLLRLAMAPELRADLEALIVGIGDALSGASEETLSALASNRDISALGRAVGIEYGSPGPVESQIFAGNRTSRERALARLPAASLNSVRIAVVAWLTVGSLFDYTTLYILDRSSAEADAALLVWAAEDPANRDELLRIRRAIRRWSYRPFSYGDATSWRVSDAEVPPAFCGDSSKSRSRAAARVGTEPSSEFMGLCAAAFRGGRGDEIALLAVISRLGPDAIPRLTPLLQASLPGVRVASARAIGRLGPHARPFALAALRSSLDGETHRAARAAKFTALLRLGDAAGAEGMKEMAASRDPDDRLAAAIALPAVANPDSAALLALLSTDDDFRVRDAADASLQRLTRRIRTADTPPWQSQDWPRWLRENPEAPLYADDAP